MINIMEIEGFKAVIKYDPEIEMFRGEFTELNGGADFYAKDIENLKIEGSISLKMFLEACENRGITPQKIYSGRFNVRVPKSLHADIVCAASADGKSLNQWVVDTLGQATHV
ncbi:MAG: toxin-antitoxin system HicB family antitoxin [SAR324 cluster bacterium]|uniref:Toxin-antitoxin system HicB family antitoxin n=1 Tax=SAR324 cluster bacterium TaxID=2024889 RepID=A0A2A4T9K9_9DELT|nr:MAG: toxin-antitoxin system HicB family antitoxin [SAR324 cluster bacterium]